MVQEQTAPKTRTKCMVYTRVMGYHRPVESFNIGKQGEHKERKFFEWTQEGSKPHDNQPG